MSFFYQPESIKLVELYSVGGLNAVVTSKLATKNNLIRYLEDTMNNAQASANWREAIISKLLGFEHLTSLHGPDAISKRNEYVEIKSESTYIGSNKKLVRLCGAGCFSHYHLPTDLLRIHDQLMVACGFHKGKIVYAISFKVDSRFEQALHKRLLRKSSRTSLKFSCADWKDQEGLELLYLCSNLDVLGITSLDEILSGHLKEVIEKLS
jgi:hypothetical protein